MRNTFPILGAVLIAAGCAAPAEDSEVVVDPRLADELELGDTNEPGTGKGDDFEHNGEEDFSETCKQLPVVEPLEDPRIVISLDGRVLHLWDEGGSYNRAFPLGLGTIGASGETITPTSESGPGGLFHARGDLQPIVDGATSAQRKWAMNYSCRIWSGKKYFNPASDQQEFRSYFAGLPFLRLEGADPDVYGIHGPINNYWRENGGELYRGYVSGGCMRMDAADLGEVYGRITGHSTPVKIQREIEIDPDGLSIDSDRFVGAGCLRDADCADSGAVCATHPDSTFKFCTKGCSATSECPVRENDISGSVGVLSFCVADVQDIVSAPGYCAIEGNAKTNNDCRSYPAPLSKRRLPLLDDDARTVSVCALP